MSASTRIQVVIPLHQPLTAGDDVMERAVEKCYAPLIAALEAREKTRIVLHASGHTLDYFARRHESLLMRIKKLAKRNQVEVLGGLFYGGIPSLLTELDVRAQVQMTAEFWDSFLGWVPTGFWLPELAWSCEVPRLLQETSLSYGFVSSSQIMGIPGDGLGLACVERGGQRLPAFVLDSALSAGLPGTEVDAWIAAAADRGSVNPRGITSVWVRAESLGLEPHTEHWCITERWLEQWLSALGTDGRIETVLPAEQFSTTRPVHPVRLREACAPELSACAQGTGSPDWVDFPSTIAEVDTLHRRMLRASDKLRDAIATMEDEELEESWSDTLATAQRLVFAAQTPDAYWRGHSPGFSDPEGRDATMAQIARAEVLIDSLIQGGDDWVSAEETDLDGDLVDEMLVANRYLAAWIVPANGGQLRTLEHRATGRNVLDAGTRRAEPFFETMANAPLANERASPSHAPRRGEALVRERDLPVDVDHRDRVGIRDFLLPDDATAQAFLAGKVGAPPAQIASWVIKENAIDEEEDCSYRLKLRAATELQGGAGGGTLEKTLSLSIDNPELDLAYHFEPESETKSRFAVEIPVRLGSGAARVLADGVEQTGSAEGSMSGVKCVRVEGADGLSLELRTSMELQVWWMRVRTTLRSLDGYRAVDNGVVLVPVFEINGPTDVALKLRVEEIKSTGQT